MSDIATISTATSGSNQLSVWASQIHSATTIQANQDNSLARIVGRLEQINNSDLKTNIEKLLLVIFQETKSPEEAADTLVKIFQSLENLIILSMILENTLADLKAAGYY